MDGLFVTGSNTDVGKTQIACAIASRLVDNGTKVAPRKPVESGCSIKDKKIFAHDANKLKLASNSEEPLDTICPYAFEQPLAPIYEAAEQGIKLDLDKLTTACKVKKDEYAVIEGAGGWLSPIGENTTNAALAMALALPVVLVVHYKLGCINQTMLTFEAITSRKLKISKVYLNQTDKMPISLQDYKYLQSSLEADVVMIPYIDGPEKYKRIKRLL